MIVRIKWVFALFILISACAVKAQTQGILSGRGQELYASYYNPASLILDPEKKWVANLFATESVISANTASFTPGKFRGKDFFRGNILRTSNSSTGFGEISLRGPAFGLYINKRATIAIKTNARLTANFWDINGRLISEIGELTKIEHEYPYSIAKGDMQINTTVYTDLTVSLSYMLWETPGHTLNGGIALKFVNGTAHSSIELSDFTGSIRRSRNDLPYLANSSGFVSTNTSGRLLSDFNLANLINPRKPGVGGDIGLIYKYSRRGHHLTLGISVTDIGRISYSADPKFSKSYNISIANDEGLYFNNNFQNSSFSETTRQFDKYPEFFNNTSEDNKNVSIGLPTKLRIQTDYGVSKSVSINIDGAVSLRRKRIISDLYSPSGLAITPRWQHNSTTLFIPLSCQEFSGFSAGLALKMGCFFIGSSSVLSALAGAKQIDFNFGVLVSPKNKTSKQ